LEGAAVGVMNLAIVPLDSDSVVAGLDRLQGEQFEHDEAYHREIARLPTQSRLRHMALHFAKYSGNFVEAQAACDEAAIQRIATDVFIIGLSTSNILNFRLSEELAQERPEAGEVTPSSFGTSLAVHAGRMAAACEKLDHLEDFPFRPVLREATVELVRSAIAFANMRGWDLRNLVRVRLKPVKEKFIHHDRM
jgi:hypothetical protein